MLAALVRRWICMSLGAFALGLVLTLGLVACGTTGAEAIPTASNIPATPGTAQLNGCPTQQAPTGLKTADVVASQGGASPVMAKKGQTIEVRLPATVRWALNMQDDAKTLTAASDNGWYDDATHSCAWRFTAAAAGSADLVYAGAQVCSVASKCPTDVVTQEFKVTVQ